jgi:hypothetical protein
MNKTLTLRLSEDEAEILVDALESDLEGYVEAAKDARANRNANDVATFTQASERITAVLKKVQAALGQE